jgi:hypothetical protein
MPLPSTCSNTTSTTTRRTDRPTRQTALDAPPRLAAVRDHPRTGDGDTDEHRPFAAWRADGGHVVRRRQPHARRPVTAPRPILLVVPVALPPGRSTGRSATVSTLGRGATRGARESPSSSPLRGSAVAAPNRSRLCW